MVTVPVSLTMSPQKAIQESDSVVDLDQGWWNVTLRECDEIYVIKYGHKGRYRHTF